ncbi:MAG: hypothetical protein RLN75_07395, partial [Longimicrobiales bacterium]
MSAMAPVPPLSRSLICLAAAVLAAAGDAVVEGGVVAQINARALPTLELAEAWTLGGPDAPEPESFTGTPGIAVNRHGALFALDR